MYCYCVCCIGATETWNLFSAGLFLKLLETCSGNGGFLKEFATFEQKHVNCFKLGFVLFQFFTNHKSFIKLQYKQYNWRNVVFHDLEGTVFN